MKDWLVFPDRDVAVATSHLPPEALQGLSGWQHATVGDIPVTIVPHDYASWRTLRERGLLIPSPTERFDWPGPKNPMQHQKSTADFLIQNEKAFCLNGLRTGKTLSALWAAEYLKQQGVVKRVAIIAPKFILDIVWERELFMSLPHRRRAIVSGERKRKKQIAAERRIDFILVNPESFHIIEDDLADVDLIIVDEFTMFKSVYVGGKKSIRYHALKRASASRMLWMMSATPAPQYPTDAYGPIRLVNPRYVTLTQFREMTMMKITQHKWVPRLGAANIVAEWMQPAVRFKREDCIDIPETETGVVDCTLSSQQKKVIDSLRDTLAARLDSGEVIETNHQAGVMCKALQVMGGGVYGDDPAGERATYKVDAGPFMETIETTVREADGPVLVFLNFQCSVDAVAEHLQAKGFQVGTSTRSSPKIQGKPVRSMELFDAFHRDGVLDCIVAVPQTMRYGLELTRSHTVLWASPPFSYETYDQANARVTGSSQEHKVMILHLVQNALSRDLFSRLKSREAFQTSVLDLAELLTTE